MNINLIPVILMGGYSKRMKQDKAFLKYNNQYWFEFLIYQLKPLFSSVYLSLRMEQYIKNKSILERYSNFLIFDKDLNIYGPLKGMLSSFLFFINSKPDFFLSLRI